MAFWSPHGQRLTDIRRNDSQPQNLPQDSPRNIWQPHVQVGRDVHALALPHIGTPWDNHPPLYPSTSAPQDQSRQPVLSSNYGSSSPLRDFFPPQGVVGGRGTILAGDPLPSLPPLPQFDWRHNPGPPAASELFERLDYPGWSDFDSNIGESTAHSEEEDIDHLAEEDLFYTPMAARSQDSAPQLPSMNPPPPLQTSPSSSRLPSRHRTRRRSSTATISGLNTAGSAHVVPKRRRISTTATRDRHPPTPSFSTAKSIEQIDLSLDSDPDDLALSSTLGKQRSDAIASQSASSTIQTGASPASRGRTKLNTIQCTICLDPPKNLTAISCGHTFCYTCLMDWLVAAERDSGGLARRSNCPTCRKPISRMKKGDIVPLEIKVKRRARRS